VRYALKQSSTATMVTDVFTVNNTMRQKKAVEHTAGMPPSQYSLLASNCFRLLGQVRQYKQDACTNNAHYRCFCASTFSGSMFITIAIVISDNNI
jgi:hypothetical protein